MSNLRGSTLVAVLVTFFVLTFSAPDSSLSANGLQEVSRSLFKAGVGDPPGEAARRSLRVSPWYSGPPPPKYNRAPRSGSSPLVPASPPSPPPPPPPSPPVY